MTDVVSRAARSLASRFADSVARRVELSSRTSADTKIALRSLMLRYQNMARSGCPLPSVWDVGFRVFSQVDEDGLILYLLALVGIGPGLFIDIGSSDGVTGSNTANLVLNLGFHGLLVDADRERLGRAEAFYAQHPDTHLFPPRCVQALVTPANVDRIVTEAGFRGEVDLLSIDIDGDDYWIWSALNCIRPRIVVVETHVEFGMNSIVVPYGVQAEAAGEHPEYHGASVVALSKLAAKLGYRLVGANRFGYNTFYVRNDLGQDILPAVQVGEVLRHPRNRERFLLFEEIKHLRYEVV